MGKEVKYLAGIEVGSWYNAEAVALWESLCSACMRPQVQSLGPPNTKVGLLLSILILMSKFQSSLVFFFFSFSRNYYGRCSQTEDDMKVLVLSGVKEGCDWWRAPIRHKRFFARQMGYTVHCNLQKEVYSKHDTDTQGLKGN